MTVPIQIPLATLVASGGQTVFPFTFRCDAPLWVAVYLTAILQPAANYSVLLNADQVSAPGGTVTFGVAPGNTIVVSLQRVSPNQQTVLLTPYSAFAAKSVEAALDRIVMLIQEFGLAQNRQSVVVAAGASGTLVQEEIPGGLVNSTTGSDGNGVFTLANVPLANALKFYVSGVRQPPSRYSRVNTTVTFNAGFFPPSGEYICADYYY